MKLNKEAIDRFERGRFKLFDENRHEIEFEISENILSVKNPERRYQNIQIVFDSKIVLENFSTFRESMEENKKDSESYKLIESEPRIDVNIFGNFSRRFEVDKLNFLKVQKPQNIQLKNLEFEFFTNYQKISFKSTIVKENQILLVFFRFSKPKASKNFLNIKFYEKCQNSKAKRLISVKQLRIAKSSECSNSKNFSGTFDKNFRPISSEKALITFQNNQNFNFKYLVIKDTSQSQNGEIIKVFDKKNFKSRKQNTFSRIISGINLEKWCFLRFIYFGSKNQLIDCNFTSNFI